MPPLALVLLLLASSHAVVLSLKNTSLDSVFIILVESPLLQPSFKGARFCPVSELKSPRISLYISSLTAVRVERRALVYIHEES